MKILFNSGFPFLYLIYKKFFTSENVLANTFIYDYSIMVNFFTDKFKLSSFKICISIFGIRVTHFLDINILPLKLFTLILYSSNLTIIFTTCTRTSRVFQEAFYTQTKVKHIIILYMGDNYLVRKNSTKIL